MSRPAAALLLILLGGGITSAQRIELIDNAKLPRFEVVSVRPGDPKANAARVDFPPGRFVQENAPLMNAVSLAFDLRPYQFAGPLPELVTRERFSIDARMPANTAAADLKLMLRSLLIDRFKMRVHVESREQDAFALTVASREGKLGPQLRPSRIDCMTRMEAQRRNEPLPPLPEGSKPCTFSYAPGRFEMVGAPLSSLAQMVSNQVGRPVVDRTGLVGTFEAEVQWSLAASTLQTGAGDVAPSASDGPSIFTAVQEQLGLRLQPTKTMVDSLVIDHVERPDSN